MSPFDRDEYVQSILNDPTKRAKKEAELQRDRERFERIQARDGMPCEDTGISHCAQCHGAYSIEAWAGGAPTCGHWAGCPEC